MLLSTVPRILPLIVIRTAAPLFLSGGSRVIDKLGGAFAHKPGTNGKLSFTNHSGHFF